MKCLVVSDHRVFYATLNRSAGAWLEPHFWLQKGERTPYADLANVFRGDPGDPATYAGFPPDEDLVAVVFYRPRFEADRIVRTIAKALPRTRFLLLALDEEQPAVEQLGRVRVRRWDEVVGRSIAEEVRATATAWQVERLREVFKDAQSVGILLQHDPDPDALASGLAFRYLLGRNRVGAPMLSFGRGIQRPENREMARLLNLHVQTVTPDALDRFDRIACVDIQPPVFGELLQGRDLDAVIDHHPEQPGYKCRFRDVRASYGSTSTILTEYLFAAGLDITQRLATALLYGIKTDTLFLDRGVSQADLLAFHRLYGLANLNLVRRMERPEIPAYVFRTFGKALQQLEVEEGLAYAFLGAVREDVIAQMAELLLQVEGAQWAVAVGLVAGDVIASIRNAGFQRAAGEVIKRAFADVGRGGGHRSSAKVIIPKEAFIRRWGSLDEAALRRAFHHDFLAEAQASATPEPEDAGARRGGAPA